MQQDLIQTAPSRRPAGGLRYRCGPLLVTSWLWLLSLRSVCHGRIVRSLCRGAQISPEALRQVLYPGLQPFDLVPYTVRRQRVEVSPCHVVGIVCSVRPSASVVDSILLELTGAWHCLFLFVL